MIWTSMNDGQYSIERALLDGSSRTILVHNVSSQPADDMSVDFITNKYVYRGKVAVYSTLV